MLRQTIVHMTAATALAMLACPAQAGGSISLMDALVQIDAPPALLGEIEAAMRAANMKSEDVICGATRFGRHWTHLGGGRASPYECPIGARTLLISGTHEYRDTMGKILPQDGLGLEQHAASVRDVDITWEWKQSAAAR